MRALRGVLSVTDVRRIELSGNSISSAAADAVVTERLAADPLQDSVEDRKP
jgi:hypothetical protein